MSTAMLDRPTSTPTIDAPHDVSIPPPAPAPRTLSEALRRGAQYHPQGRGQLYNKTTGATCAMGAMAVGFLGPGWTRDDPELFSKRSVAAFLWAKTGIDLNQRVELPPVCGGDALGPVHNLCSIIISLNDGHRWSREAIADWLEAHGF